MPRQTELFGCLLLSETVGHLRRCLDAFACVIKSYVLVNSCSFRCAILAVLLVAPVVRAQSNEDFRAADAFATSSLVVAPVVYGAPRASRVLWRIAGAADFETNAMYPSVGATLQVGGRELPGAITVVLLPRACKGCETWLITLVEIDRPLASFVDLRANASFGTSVTRLGSTAAALGTSLVMRKEWRHTTIALYPGLMLAGVDGERTRDHAIRPTIGVSFGAKGKRLSWQIGSQTAVLRGGRLTVGVALSWHRGSTSER